jgi:hypothetical protein
MYGVCDSGVLYTITRQASSVFLGLNFGFFKDLLKKIKKNIAFQNEAW